MPNLSSVRRLVILFALAVSTGCSDTDPPAPPAAHPTASTSQTPPSAEMLANATYADIYDQPITLTDGVYEGEPFAGGGAARPQIAIARDFRLTGDLTGDGIEEAVVLLAENSGGSGSQDYLAVVGWAEGSMQNLGTTLVGERVQIRSARIEGGRIVLQVVQVGPGDAMCCPTEEARRTFVLDAGGLLETGSELTGTLSLEDLAGVEWVLSRFGWDEDAPAEPQITLRLDNGRFVGSAGCNSYFADVAAAEAPGEITIGLPGTTRMACPEDTMALETRYLSALEHVRRYSFLTGQLALTAVRDGHVELLVFKPRPPSD